MAAFLFSVFMSFVCASHKSCDVDGCFYDLVTWSCICCHLTCVCGFCNHQVLWGILPCLLNIINNNCIVTSHYQDWCEKWMSFCFWFWLLFCFFKIRNLQNSKMNGPLWGMAVSLDHNGQIRSPIPLNLQQKNCNCAHWDWNFNNSLDFWVASFTWDVAHFSFCFAIIFTGKTSRCSFVDSCCRIFRGMVILIIRICLRAHFLSCQVFML